MLTAQDRVHMFWLVIPKPLDSILFCKTIRNIVLVLVKIDEGWVTVKSDAKCLNADDSILSLGTRLCTCM